MAVVVGSEGTFGVYYVTETGNMKLQLGEYSELTDSAATDDGKYKVDSYSSDSRAVWPIATLPIDIIEKASDGSLVVN